MDARPLHIGFLLFPQLTQLDLTGPAQVLAKMDHVQLHYVWKNSDAVATDCGFSILPTDTLASCPPLDLICVPGGSGIHALLTDEAILGWLQQQASQAQWVTSVCTGSLLLGAAGLLQGYRATTHWAWKPTLEKYGTTLVDQRVVVDGNRITGGGVTSGIDFAFHIVELLQGRDSAETILLSLEYTPQPFSAGGSPAQARQEILRRVEERYAKFRQTLKSSA